MNLSTDLVHIAIEVYDGSHQQQPLEHGSLQDITNTSFEERHPEGAQPLSVTRVGRLGCTTIIVMGVGDLISLRRNVSNLS